MLSLMGVFVLALALIGAASTPASASAASCPHQEAKPGKASKAQFARSIKCLVDKERHKRGLARLTGNGDLTHVEKSHMRRMFAKHCFAHRCPGEKSLTHRIKASGYPRAGKGFAYGEILGFAKTPKDAIRRFLKGSQHRHNLLFPKAREIGIATQFGSPKRGVDDNKYVTYGLLIAKRNG